MRRNGVDREDNPVPGKRPSNGAKKNKQRDRNTAFPVRSLSEERQYVIGQFPKKDLINEWRLDNLHIGHALPRERHRAPLD
jgi:hypothetical protein